MLSVGCSIETDSIHSSSYNLEEAKTSTHAVFRVRQIAGYDGQIRGDALAGFVQVPDGADPLHFISLAGLESTLPAPGECKKVQNVEFDQTPEQAGQAELLEAQSVELRTESGSHQLTPYAFPAVANVVRGVVYTSRDNDGHVLPSGVIYNLLGRSIDFSGPHDRLTASQPLETPQGMPRGFSLNSKHLSPPRPEDVQMNGVPLASANSGLAFAPSDVLDLSWAPTSNATDRIFVLVNSPQGQWSCGFNDADGYGSLPLLTPDGVSMTDENQSVLLEIHRVRATAHLSEDIPSPGRTVDNSSAAPNQGLAQVRVTFDVAVETLIQFEKRADSF